VLALAERFADQPDVLGEVGLVDEAARPERLHQLVLADRVACALDQQHQRIEHLRRQRNSGPVCDQPPLSRIELELAEAVDRLFVRRRHARRSE
jgi:hypothetical protein